MNRYLQIAILVSFGFFGACQTQQRGATLLIGSDLNNPPWAAVDKNGQPFGRDVVMMDELGAIIEYTAAWKVSPFDDLLLKLGQGEFKVVCATMNVTNERRKHAAFTRPYYRTVLSVVARSGVGEPSKLADLTNRKIGVSKGTTSEEALKRELPSATLVFEDRAQAIGELLRAKRIDAAVMDGPVASTLVANSQGELVELTNLGGEDYCLAVPLGERHLLESLNRALDEMERSGRLAALNREYGIAPSLDFSAQKAAALGPPGK